MKSQPLLQQGGCRQTYCPISPIWEVLGQESGGGQTGEGFEGKDTLDRDNQVKILLNFYGEANRKPDTQFPKVEENIKGALKASKKGNI